jgi:hypothetical protein
VEISDLFGAGAVLSGGKLIIPRSNLEAVGLSPGSNSEAAIIASVVLVAMRHFDGPLIDSDGATLIDSDGEPLFFQHYRTDSEVMFLPIRRVFDSTESFIYWRWLISFFEAV